MPETRFLRLLKEYPEALGDRRQFSSLLRDYMPGMTLQANLLLYLHDLGIHTAIENADIIDNSFVYRFSKKLCDDYGVSRRNADWAVAVWYSCYGDDILGKKIQIIPIQNKPDTASHASNSDEQNYEPIEKTFDITADGYVFDWRNVYDYTIENEKVIIEKYVAFDEEDVMIPETIEDYPVTEIGREAFENCAAMKELKLPGTLKMIRERAFHYCTFESIVLPDSLLEIESSAFGYCALKSIVIPPHVRRINSFLFRECEQLKRVTLPYGLRSIERFAFSGCKSLEYIDIPEGVAEIGENAFLGCEKLDKVRIPGTAGKLGPSYITSENTESLFGDPVRQNITIYCNAGSEILKYARRHHIKMDRYENFSVT